MSEPLSSLPASSQPASNQVMLRPSRSSAASPPPPPPPPPITFNPPSKQAENSTPSTSSRSDPALHQSAPVPRSLLHTLRPPRSSSLLATSVSSLRSHSPSPAAPSPGFLPPLRDPTRAPPVSLKQRPTTPSSQSDKTNFTSLSPREGSRARNRWSTSTISSTSSRTSPFATRRTAGSPNRRASLEVTGLRGSPPLVRQSSQRLYQGRVLPSLPNHNTGVAPETTGHLGSTLGSTPGGVPQPAMGQHGANQLHQHRGTSPGPSAVVALPEARVPYDQDMARDVYPSQGHSRERSGKGSQDLGKRPQKPPSQKAVLSKALQKANAAVQLDNAQNLAGAREAYAEACQLLQQVLARATTEEDRRKLEVIQKTYTGRIAELDQMVPWQEDTTKALPARPESVEYMRDIYAFYSDYGGAVPRTNPAHRASLVMGEGSNAQARQHQHVKGPTQSQRPPYNQISSPERWHPSQGPDPGLPQSAVPARTASVRRLREDPSRLSLAPLSSARSVSPERLNSDDVYDALDDSLNSGRDPQSPIESRAPRSSQRTSQEGGPGSWLDPIDESGPSPLDSAPHSQTSSQIYQRRFTRSTTASAEAEFDSALDAAIDAAYNDHLEPAPRVSYGTSYQTRVSMMGVYRGAEGGRQSERWSARDSVHYSVPMAGQESAAIDFGHGGYLEDASSDEERILEEFTSDLAIEDFTMGQQPRPARDDWPPAHETSVSEDFRPLPPMPGPHSSVLAERLPPPDLSQAPSSSLPQPPSAGHSRQPSATRSSPQLKIETTNLGAIKPVAMTALKRQSSVSTTGKSDQASIAESVRATSIEEKSTSSSSLAAVATDGAGLAELVAMGRKPTGSDDSSLYAPASPPFSKLRKKFSSSSLRSMKSRNISLSNLEEVADLSPTLSIDQQQAPQPPSKPPMPGLPSALAATLMSSFKDNAEMALAGGLFLFDTIPQGNEHGMASNASPDAPVPLEHCPTDSYLRPFWLMRCLYQTLVHPRGGYLSSKLFVPRDVWRVKGVKLKNVEEKIAQCDYLTAALMKLAKVDAFDADALLVEMQEFEGAIEQAQQVLTRKLGSEVGSQGSGFVPKEGVLAADGEGGLGGPRTGTGSSKTSSFSWRRLRSKPSSIGLTAGPSTSRLVADGFRENSSVPMTTKPASRPAKRDPTQAQFSGPNAVYMASLAHLFDAAQTIDLIGRQVDDPGLKHADKTQVGLELGMRHAAEFFAFYILRFVLADLGMMLDKFLKRGTEWVLV